jgi:protein-disulfide isomerase
VALLAVAVVAWNLISSAVDETVREPVPLAYGSPQELVALAEGVTAGNPDAQIQIMEFGDYQCPSCRQFFSSTKPFLDLSYVQPGTVAFTFHDFPLYDVGHANAFLAARAARCAGDQGDYWGFHDRLFQNQASWALRPDPSGDFIDYAGDMGLDTATFRSCLASDAHAEVVTANRLLGEQLGVQGTPTILIDTGEGRAIRVDDYSIENIRRIVDAALPSATPPAGDTSAAGGDSATTSADAEAGAAVGAGVGGNP